MECYTCWWNTVAASARSGITPWMDVLDGQPLAVSFPFLRSVMSLSPLLFACSLASSAVPRPLRQHQSLFLLYVLLHSVVCLACSHAHLFRPRCALVYFLIVCAVVVGSLLYSGTLSLVSSLTPNTILTYWTGHWTGGLVQWVVH